MPTPDRTSTVATEAGATPRQAADARRPSYREALRTALAAEMRRDERVVVFGEDVAAAGGVFKVTDGLLAEFGPMRVRDTPISENALIGAAIGAAATGLRPVVEIMFADFLANCFDQVVNHAAKLTYMSGGQLALPMVIRCAHGGGIGFAAQHSQPATSWLLPFAGIKIVAPATAADAGVLLTQAIRDPDPVLFCEHKALYGVRAAVDEDDGAVPGIGIPRLRRHGDDVTLVALSGTVPVALAAADLLAAEQVRCDVIDLAGLVPLDESPIIASLARTGRLLLVQEEAADGGWAGMVLSRLVRRAWNSLRQAPVILSGSPNPVPYSPVLEKAHSPGVDAVVAAVRQQVGAA